MEVYAGTPEPELVYARKDELERLRKALQEIKALVCGDRAPRWTEDGWAVTMTRGEIADICDMALDPSLKGPPVRIDTR